MTAAGAGSSGVTRTPSASESARFGHTVERITVGDRWADALDPAGLSTVIAAEVAASEARTIVLRYPSEAVFVARALPSTGRAVHPAGTLIYWESRATDREPEADVRELIAPVAEADSAAALEVIADSFRGYVNHYRANPLIADSAVTDGYLEWAASTIADSENRAFVIDHEGTVAGVATIDTAGGTGPWDILLAGMATRFQGKGLYLRLIRGLLAAAADAGQERVIISTQSHNIPVQRAWAKLGFAPVSAIDTVHLVAPEPSNGPATGVA